jgi:hypothetical protein
VDGRPIVQQERVWLRGGVISAGDIDHSVRDASDGGPEQLEELVNCLGRRSSYHVRVAKVSARAAASSRH